MSDLWEIKHYGTIIESRIVRIASCNSLVARTKLLNSFGDQNRKHVGFQLLQYFPDRRVVETNQVLSDPVEMSKCEAPEFCRSTGEVSSRQTLSLFMSRVYIWVRTKKSFTIKVDYMIGILGNPDLRLPGDVSQKTSQNSNSCKCGHENKS